MADVQAVEKTQESAKGPQPFRFSIVVGGVYGDHAADFVHKIASLQILRPESRGFKQNLEGVAVAGEILPRPPACQKAFFDKLRAAAQAALCFCLSERIAKRLMRSGPDSAKLYIYREATE